jgi:erythromycin esterase-like protein
MQSQSSIISHQESIIDYLRVHHYPLQTEIDLDDLIDQIGESKIVMMGEASHGTHEYYTWRAMLSQRLIKDKGFNFIAVEGDWPDCYRVNRYIKNYSHAGASAFDVLHSFNRWPTWMWANWEMVALTEWLYDYNLSQTRNKKAGFYGLDVYSLQESLEVIINYLYQTDPEALQVAQKAYQCFQPYQRDEGTGYAYASLMVPAPCTNEVTKLLTEIQRKVPQYNSDIENVFNTEQNAFVAFNAEKYYRTMLSGGSKSWNIRDSHMMETLERLLNFHGSNAKAIVWAHNTHIGDARATDMRLEGMHNLGEYARKAYGSEKVFLIGFGSYSGTVLASLRWGESPQLMKMPLARDNSWEYLLAQAGIQNGYLLSNDLKNKNLFDNEIDHRAIGVVYQPQQEKFGNYVPSILTSRYNAFMFFKFTKALHAIHSTPNGLQMPETYPFGV